MSYPLVDKDAVILVTGGTGDIGSEICAQGAAAGAQVIVHGSRAETCEAAISGLRARVPHGSFEALPVPLGETGAPSALIENAAAIHGRIDAVIHCAIAAGSPGGVTGPLAGTRPESYGPLLARGAGAFQELCFAALPLLAQSKGAMVVLASDSGVHAAPRQSLIGAHMAAIMAFVRNLGLEVARDGVRINCISPSFVADTAIFERFASAPGGRAERAAARAGLGLPTPADIAPLALFLSGPAAAKITGQIISVNGGLSA